MAMVPAAVGRNRCILPCLVPCLHMACLKFLACIGSVAMYDAVLARPKGACRLCDPGAVSAALRGRSVRCQLCC